MIKILLSLFIFISYSSASIQHFFPKLESRVVDQAKILSPDTKKQLILTLKKHEEQTSNQVVVVILNNLHGYEIEDFSYKLARHWALGEKDKNNGVLLFAAIENKKLRIEVGYGLEGSLTDKISHEIIEYTLKPNFQEKKFDQGITEAVSKILLAIKGEYINEFPSNTNIKDQELNPYLFFLFFIITFISMLLNGVARTIENQKMYKITKAISTSSFITIFIISFLGLGYISFLIFPVLCIIIIIITKDVDFKELKSKKVSNYNNTSNSSNSRSSSRSFSSGGGSFGGGGASGGW